MDIDELVIRFPRVWHATYPGGWEAIRTGGLQSSTALLEAAGRGDEAKAVRTESVRLSTPAGDVVLREQVPNKKDPSAYPDGLSTDDWWQLINRRSYLFAVREDLDQFVGAYLEKGEAQEIITFETRRLLGPVSDHVEIAMVNAGAFPKATSPAKGKATFVTLPDFTAQPTRIREVTVTVPAEVTERAVISVVSVVPDEGPVRIFPPVKARV